MNLPEVDKQYALLVADLFHRYDEGELKLEGNRTDKRTISNFGRMCRFDLRKSFPLLQLKKTITKSVVAELVGFLRGYENVKDFQDLGTNIWNEWADPDTGDLGPIYGAQWRAWQGYSEDGYSILIDQLQEAVDTIKTNPSDRRILVSAWNPAEIDRMALPPCHYSFQFNCGPDNTLDLLWNQRSVDVFLGLPFNIASYGVLLAVVARLTGRTPRYLIGSLGNVHLYENQLEGAREVWDRSIKAIKNQEGFLVSPKVDMKLDSSFTDLSGLDGLEPEDISFENYKPLPRIKVEVAV